MRQLSLPAPNDCLTFQDEPLRSGQCKFCKEPIATVCYWNKDNKTIVRFLCFYHGKQHDQAKDSVETGVVKLWTVHFILKENS